MKFKITLITLFFALSFGQSIGQSVIELKEKRAEIEALKAEVQAEVDAYQAEIDVIDSELEILGGWQKGLLGSVGLNFARQRNLATSPNPNSSTSSLAIGVNAYANSIREDDFWRNKAVINLGWQSLDTDTQDDEKDGFLDDRTIDLLNISSLYGRKISETLALSGLGELNSSIFNLFNPGTVDLGAGLTYSPNSDLVVVVHPINYHIAFSRTEGVSSEGAGGAKIRADYNHTFPNGLGWASTLTSFIPYQSKDPTLFEYTWLNSLNYTIAGGVGLNLTLGLRSSEFERLTPESSKTQTWYSFGVSYGFSK